MPRKSSEFRRAVWDLLQDGQWHGILELIQVGGVRAAARVHELRHEEGRRIICVVRDSKSAYRYTCDCGPIPGLGIYEPGAKSCERCRAALREAFPNDPAPAPEPEPVKEPHPAQQLGLFGRVA